MKLVESLRKGLEVMEAFSGGRPRLRLQEVADLTGLPKATAYRILRTLVSLGYISYDQAAALYRLTPKVMALGFTVLSSLDLREAALPHLEEFSRQTGQNVNLGILDGAEVIYVERIKQRATYDLDLFVGSRLPAHASAIGRAILAFLPPEELEQAVGLMLADPEAAEMIGPGGQLLRQRLEEVRLRGYALNVEETFSGLMAAGAPVFDSRGQVEGAVNVAVFAQVMTREELVQSLVPRLVETAALISADRGAAGPSAV
jgi:IclR family pca regulon transcriptional regulator